MTTLYLENSRSYVRVTTNLKGVSNNTPEEKNSKVISEDGKTDIDSSLVDMNMESSLTIINDSNNKQKAEIMDRENRIGQKLYDLIDLATKVQQKSNELKAKISELSLGVSSLNENKLKVLLKDIERLSVEKDDIVNIFKHIAEDTSYLETLDPEILDKVQSIKSQILLAKEKLVEQSREMFLPEETPILDLVRNHFVSQLQSKGSEFERKELIRDTIIAPLKQSYLESQQVLSLPLSLENKIIDRYWEMYPNIEEASDFGNMYNYIQNIRQKSELSNENDSLSFTSGVLEESYRERLANSTPRATTNTNIPNSWSDMISMLISGSSDSDNILMVVMIIMLISMNIDSKLLKVSAEKSTINTSQRELLGDLLSGFQALQAVVPYTPPVAPGGAPKPSTYDLFEIFDYAYNNTGGKTPDLNLRKNLDKFINAFESIAPGAFENINWSNSTDALSRLTTLFDRVFIQTNANLVLVNSPTIVPFDKDPTTGKYIIGKNDLGSITNGLGQGVTNANNIQQSDSAVTQTRSTVYEQHLKSALNALDFMKQTYQVLWR